MEWLQKGAATPIIRTVFVEKMPVIMSNIVVDCDDDIFTERNPEPYLFKTNWVSTALSEVALHHLAPWFTQESRSKSIFFMSYNIT